MNVSLNALDNMGSLLWASNNGGASQGFAYSPFGSTPVHSAGNSMLPGFNGERLDPVSQTYHLGNGYRTYNPVLMRFNAPDSWSPFGAGGLNQYAYCEGDPINRSDPSGHMSGGAIAGIILGTLGMVLSAIVTCGSSIPATIAAGVAWSAAEVAQAITTGLGVAADVSGIVSGATQESDPKLSQDFGWASMAFGIASFATGSVDAIHGKVTERSASYDLLHDDDGKGPKGLSEETANTSSSQSKQNSGAHQLGKYFYLYKGSDNSDRIILDAHAVQDPLHGFVSVPEGSELRYFCPDGYALDGAALEGSGQNIFIPYEDVAGGANTPKYLLGKFAGNSPSRVRDVAQRYKVDILTVRNRRGLNKIGKKFITNGDVFKALNDSGYFYKNIDASHCRSLPTGNSPRYRVKVV